MSCFMKNVKNRLLLIVLTGLLFVINVPVYAEGAASSEEPKKGPHGGRLLEDQGFSLELNGGFEWAFGTI